MMEIRWSPEAADDLEQIGRRIAQNNPSAAGKTVKTLYDGITSLRKFPNMGRVGRLENSRELIFRNLPYIVVYRVSAEIIEISRIYHAAQDWP